MNYQSIYDRLIERARGRVVDGYCERHHIVPRCLGGSDDADNIVALTAEEHYVCHQLLVKLHPHHLGILSAAHIMASSGNTPRPTSRIYGWLRRRMAEAQTGQKRPLSVGQKIGDKLRGRKRDPESVAKVTAKIRGLVRTDEQRARMSRSKIGIQFAPSHLENMRKCQLGKKQTPETIAKRTAWMTGRIVPPEVGAAISAAKKGKKTGQIAWNKGLKGAKASDETRAKMTASQTAAHVRRRAANESIAA